MQTRGSIIKPGRNVWRVEQARRAPVIIDGATFFDTIRAAFFNGKHFLRS
jgi:phospholipase D1/2